MQGIRMLCRENIEYCELKDADLISLYRSGDIDSFNGLVLRHYKKVINICYRYMGNQKDAEDVAQEIFVKIFKNIGKLKTGDAFSVWLYRITINTCKSNVRSVRNIFRRGMQPINDLHDYIFYNNDHDHCHTRMNNGLIQEAINRLPFKKKTMIILYYIEELSYNEIAEITKSKLGTIKSTLARSREELERILKEIR